MHIILSIHLIQYSIIVDTMPPKDRVDGRMLRAYKASPPYSTASFVIWRSRYQLTAECTVVLPPEAPIRSTLTGIARTCEPGT